MSIDKLKKSHPKLSEQISELKSNYHKLENKSLALINSLIDSAGSARNLSELVYDKEDNINTILSRCREATPYKLAKLLKTLEEVNEKVYPSNNLVKKKARMNVT